MTYRFRSLMHTTSAFTLTAMVCLASAACDDSGDDTATPSAGGGTSHGGATSTGGTGGAGGTTSGGGSGGDPGSGGMGGATSAGGGGAGGGTTAPRPIDVTAGPEHSCALFSDGTAQCWGSNGNGELGTGDEMDRAVPVPVMGLTTAAALSAGGASHGHTCAALADGTARCWGANLFMQLGGNCMTGDDANTPVAVEGISSASQLASGGLHGCARLTDGSIQCWGQNSAGQLGPASPSESCIPVDSGFGFGFTAIAAGVLGHTCGLRSPGTIRCWGLGHAGQLGSGKGTGDVTGINSATNVVTGNSFSCALLADGTVRCWGYNNSGQLGDEDGGVDKDEPQTVFALTDAVDVTAGGAHACAVNAGGTVQCWGFNGNSQLGLPGLDESDVPIVVAGINNAVAVAAGGQHTCALLADDSVVCWGRGTSGQLGDGLSTSSPTPVTVAF